jgi:protoporphyrinogen oxidase
MMLKQANNQVDYLIVGAGPCGLGAAHRLHELRISSWRVIEQSEYPGGLATSFIDDQGFTWDVGGHVVHSHYPYFDEVFHAALGKNLYQHERESWVWLAEKFIPYPFQNNLRFLPPELQWDCIQGLLALARQTKPKTKQAKAVVSTEVSFHEWILAHFGAGIAEHFLFPYNKKIWAYPLKKMNKNWVGDRVAPIDLIKSLENILQATTDVAWGPNKTFYFPAKGGTGSLWRKIASALPQTKFNFKTSLVSINATDHTAVLSSGEVVQYQQLISTLPLTNLLTTTTFPAHRPHWLQPSAQAKTKKALFASTVHIVGIGLEGTPHPDLRTKCWLYYPESNLPFYRVTVFSNYSPTHVPKPGKQWSLMCEVSESAYTASYLQSVKNGQKKLNTKKIIADVIKGLKEAKLITTTDAVVSTWTHTAWLGYPTPTLAREKVLTPTLRALEKYDLYSRGRFGAWKYEVSNMDHTFMQGVEVINRLVLSEPEKTVWHPTQVNHPNP